MHKCIVHCVFRFPIYIILPSPLLEQYVSFEYVWVEKSLSGMQPDCSFFS